MGDRSGQTGQRRGGGLAVRQSQLVFGSAGARGRGKMQRPPLGAHPLLRSVLGKDRGGGDAPRRQAAKEDRALEDGEEPADGGSRSWHERSWHERSVRGIVLAS